MNAAGSKALARTACYIDEESREEVSDGKERCDTPCRLERIDHLCLEFMVNAQAEQTKARCQQDQPYEAHQMRVEPFTHPSCQH